LSVNEEWQWDAELDALMAAPEYHVVLFENEHVRVLETRVPAGHRVPLHTHRWAGVQYIMGWSDFVRRDHDGEIVADSRGFATNPLGRWLWSGPLEPHTVENVGDREIRVIAVEQKGC
jgi:hypothetical protein